MATVQKRRNGDDSTSFLAWVRVGKFKPATRAFQTRKEALAWADALERELRKRRDEGGVPRIPWTHRYVRFARDSKSSGLTPPRWRWRRA